MKKRVMAMMICTLAIGISACGGKEEETQKESVPSVEASAEASETAVTEEAAPTEKNTVEGMVTEESMGGLTILTADGQYFLFLYPEAGVETTLKDGVRLGEVISVTYTGSPEAGDTVAQKIDAGTTKTELAREDYEFALILLNHVMFMDQEGLADLVTYPVYIEMADGKSVTPQNKEEFLAIEREALFTEDLLMLANYNLFKMIPCKAGFVIGDGRPSITYNKTGDGYGITGITSAGGETE